MAQGEQRIALDLRNVPTCHWAVLRGLPVGRVAETVKRSTMFGCVQRFEFEGAEGLLCNVQAGQWTPSKVQGSCRRRDANERSPSTGIALWIRNGLVDGCGAFMGCSLVVDLFE